MIPQSDVRITDGYCAAAASRAELLVTGAGQLIKPSQQFFTLYPGYLLWGQSSPGRMSRLFEQLIVLETDRMLRYLSIDGRIFFWRTKDDQEVDLLIENRGELIAAVEIKSSSVITPQYFSGLRAFAEEHPTVPRYIVADVPESFQLQGLATVLPWREYLGLLNKWLRQ